MRTILSKVVYSRSHEYLSEADGVLGGGVPALSARRRRAAEGHVSRTERVHQLPRSPGRAAVVREEGSAVSPRAVPGWRRQGGPYQLVEAARRGQRRSVGGGDRTEGQIRSQRRVRTVS